MKLQSTLLLICLTVSSSLLVATNKAEVGLPLKLAELSDGTQVVPAQAVTTHETISVRAKKAAQKTSTVLFCSKDYAMPELVKIVSGDLEFSDQFTVDIRHHKSVKNKKPEKKELKKLFEEGYDLALYFFPTNDQGHDGTVKFNFYVYSTSKGVTVLKKPKDTVPGVITHRKEGDTIPDTAAFKKEFVVAHGHMFSSFLLQQLTGSPGLCTHTIAYSVKKTPTQKDIYMSDYLGHKIIPVVTSLGIKLAPSFHNKAPYIFFTQLTKRNARLQMRDLRSKFEETCFSFPGLNMQLALAPDGIRAVVCLSGGKGNSELFHYDQRICNKVGKKVFQQITNNKGNNVSPCYLPNGDLVFCSDFETGFGRPQIYYLDRKKNKTKRLTSGKGYCAAPSYCAQTNKVVYTRLINKVFQLFSIDLNQLGKASSFDERQLTFCAGDKTEPQWDETGKYVLFLFEFKGEHGHRKSKIAWWKANSDTICPIATTDANEQKSFPALTSRILYQG